MDQSNDITPNNIKKNIDWHTPFYSSLELELEDYLDKLEIRKEYPLNRQPIRIDLLIKKSSDDDINLTIGEHFKRYNIIEYKSPSDSLGPKQFHKVMGYYNLLMSYGFMDTAGNYVKIDSPGEVTISFIRYGKPVKLIEYLKSLGYILNKSHNGIYHFYNKSILDNDDYDAYKGTLIQIIVQKELPDSYKWLKMLKTDVTPDDLDIIDKESEMSDNVVKVYRIFSVGAFLNEMLKKNPMAGGDSMNLNEMANMIIEYQRDELAKKDIEIKEALAQKDAEISELKEQIRKLSNKIAVL